MVIRCLLVVGLFGSLTVFAQVVYRWVDADGLMHFTDDPASIPPKYRASASKMAPPELGVVHVKEAQAVEPVDSPQVTSPKPPEPAEAEADPQQVERQWRGAFKALNRRVEELESSLVADRKLLATVAERATYNPVTGMYFPTNEGDQLRERIRKSELELKNAQEELQDLEREASRNSIPREWRR